MGCVMDVVTAVLASIKPGHPDSDRWRAGGWVVMISVLGKATSWTVGKANVWGSEKASGWAEYDLLGYFLNQKRRNEDEAHICTRKICVS